MGYFYYKYQQYLYSPMKNEDEDWSFVEKALYRIWTDDLRLTMALLYHWVKRAHFLQKMN